MKTRSIVIAILIVAVVGVVLLKRYQRHGSVNLTGSEMPSSERVESPLVTSSALPRLVSLGAGKCIPCRQMQPIRAELKQEYAGQLVVEFYDVWERPEIAREYGIRAIPTLIYYDEHGSELVRQEGFVPKEDIVARMVGFGMLE